MNDSLRTNVFVQFSPEKIACACIYLAARKFQVYPSIFGVIFVIHVFALDSSADQPWMVADVRSVKAGH